MDKHDVDRLAQIVWDYHLVNHQLKKVDALLVLCSNDLRVGEWAIRLFKEGWAPSLIFSGGIAHANDLLATGWGKPEAEVYSALAITQGVPKENIIIENTSTNTGENISFTKELLKKLGRNPTSFILVQKPYMERRSFATFKKLWPEKECVVTSPPIEFENYPTGELPKDLIINIMVGDLQRIKIYGEKGFQIPQEIPADVWHAFERLVELGYNKHLIPRS